MLHILGKPSNAEFFKPSALLFYQYRTENTIAMQRAEIESLQNQQAKLNDELKNARAAADEAVRQIPRAHDAGVKEGVRVGLSEGAEALAATGDKPRKSPADCDEC